MSYSPISASASAETCLREDMFCIRGLIAGKWQIKDREDEKNIGFGDSGGDVVGGSR